MRVICPFCSSHARITSSNALNQEKTITDLYCCCTNAKQCGATFVFSLSYSRPLNPPLNNTLAIATDLINRLSKEERAALRQSVFQ